MTNWKKHIIKLKQKEKMCLKIALQLSTIHTKWESIKSVFAVSEATKKWTMPIRNWGVVLNQLGVSCKLNLQLSNHLN